jgi:predicted phosphate transport protein (TIGR00153 family)
MLGWFRALMPREERFFDLFARHSHTVVAGAEALRQMLDGGDGVPQQYRIIMEREQEADFITRDVLIAVRRTFITPFDRGDIQDLMTSMDNTIDQMQKTAKSVMLFNIRSFTPQMKEMGDAIVKCAVLVEEAVPLLRAISTHATRISALTEQITQIEGRADDLHDLGLKELFETQGSTNPMAFITGNEVYDHLEKVVDRFDDVANELQSVVIDQV